MRFGVLGPLAVWTADGTPVRIPERKVRALLADLLVHEGRPVSVDRLADDLYAEGLPASPAGALQVKVSRLRQALGDAGRELVLSRPPGYLLQAEEVDAEEFRGLVARARAAADSRTRADLLTKALALWRGPAYADVADHAFARAAITRLQEERLVALEEQAEVRLELGEHHRLAGDLAELVAEHPLRERLRAAYLLALYRAGRHSEALDSYAGLRRQLVEDLGLDPGPELVALQKAILRQDPRLSPVSRPRSNLPAALTELVGREEAVAEVGKLMAGHRLVTLTGPGGVGKTRLAVEAARLVADGAWLVELAGLDRTADPAAVASVISVALGLHEEGSGPVADLVEALGNKRLLLVLDNCEHLAAPVAMLVEQLLGAAPELRILATSQEPLGLTGEVLWPVLPLDLPGPGADPLAAGAVQLFLARATGLTFGPDNADAVTEICRRLDGIPLALELAAARVRALGVRELATRLDDRFRVLTSGHRTAPARQRTLRAMIEWSWQLLPEPDRAVLRRLAVHGDTFTLESAEAIASDNDLDVLGLLPGLVDRSLVAPAVGDRFRLLESVRAYGIERLHEAGEYDLVRGRHLQYYTELAQRAGPHLHGGDQLVWLDRLDNEAVELRGALDEAVRRTETVQALRLVDALGWYWCLRGRLTESRRCAELALGMPGPGSEELRERVEVWRDGLDLLRGVALGPVVARSNDPRALWFLAFANRGFGEPADTEQLTEQALAGFRATSDRWGVAAALSLRATLSRARGDLTTARRDAGQAEAIFRELGDRWGLLKATGTLAELAEIAGDYDRAGRLHTDGLRLAEDLRFWSEVSFKLSGLGRIALLTGDLVAAADLHARALRLALAEADQVAEEFAEIGLALTARRQGDLDLAESHLRHWLDWLRRVDGEPGLALALAELGFIAELRGSPDEALALHRRSLAAAERIGDPRAVALATEGLAGAHALAGRRTEATGLLAEAAALRSSVGAPLPPAERGDVDRITARLSADF